MIISSSLIVVEGITDIQFLSTFIQAEFIITNGSDIPKKTIEYIKAVHQTGRQVIVLTDPDSPGQRIRSILDESIKGLTHVYIQKKDAIKKNKVGVAESTSKVILEALNHLIVNQDIETSLLTMEDLLTLHLIGSIDAKLRRDYVSEFLHLGHTNGKTLLKRLQNLNISFNKLKEVLANYETSFGN
jgi:ribonuclease M5